MIQIKKAVLNDLHQVLKLSLKFDSEEIDKNIKVEEAVDKGLVWVVVDNNEIVGYVLVQLFDETHYQLPSSVFIADLFVLENYRGQGLGSKLVKTVLSENFSNDFSRFTLTHEPQEKHLTNFYGSFGFKVIGVSKGGNVMMEKER